MSNAKLELPPMHQICDLYDATTSRLVNGLLSPEPDYVFCALGTNDPGIDITADYIRWLIALRKACGRAAVFCVVPPLGWHMAEVRSAVSARNQAGDQRVYLIDLAPLESGFRVGQGATAFAYDGVHPSVYGNALLGALITAETQKRLSN